MLTPYRLTRHSAVVELEEALVQLARLGLKGDTRSVAQLVRRLLRTGARNGTLGAKSREGLADLLAQEPINAMRFASQAVNGNGSDSLVTIDLEPTGVDPLLETVVLRRVEAVVVEHQNVERLAAVGLSPTRTLLFIGPPGVGKTLTAKALARWLGLPLHTVNLSALVSSYLGKTGQNLRDIFAEARASGAVLLLDEFDAIAKRRDDPTDIGELKRTVSVLLQELEALPQTSLVVAATNHAELLDRAVWRRFDLAIEFTLPNQEIREKLLQRQLAALKHRAALAAVRAAARATAGFSASDVCAVARASVRRALLEEQNVTRMLVEEALARLLSTARLDGAARVLFCEVASKQLKLSQRSIAQQLGVSHVTVGNLLRKSGGPQRRRRK